MMLLLLLLVCCREGGLGWSASSRGVPIHYEVIGDGRPHVMLHGAPADHHHIEHDMEPSFVGRAGWRRIYPDLPGMGDSPSNPAVTSHADMVGSSPSSSKPRRARREVRGDRHLLRCPSGAGLTRRHGPAMDGFFAYVPAFRPGGSRTVPEARVLVPDEDVVAGLAPHEGLWAGAHTVHAAELLAEFRSRFLPAFAKANHGFLQQLEQGSLPDDPPPMEEPFPAPTLILTGRQDSWCGYVDGWAVLEDYPRATFAVLDRAAHGLSGEQPVLFRALVSEWLDRVEEYAS